MSLLALAAAAAALGAAWLVGWPAWTASRERSVRDTNTERYLAWRGRAREAPPAANEGWTAEERRRFLVAGALVLIGVVALVAFFVAS